MTPTDQVVREAHQAIAAAIHSLGVAVVTPLARIDSEARAGYLELHTVTAPITQRLADEVGRGLYQLQAVHGRVTASIGNYEQQSLNALVAPLSDAAARVQQEIAQGVVTVGGH